jgi:CheY-like chemotaxis protein
MRMFLPQVEAIPADQISPRIQYIGYIGVRRRIMIVDNEKTDRDLLASMLEPLGFHLAEAASGQECLDLIPAFCPHLIFMDLAMPYIDGWETIRFIQRGGLTDCKIAIISANAFEKGADNDAGISAENFITKPVNMHELLDWIGNHLGLEWVTIEASSTMTEISSSPMPSHYPSREHLRNLGEQVELGYVKGIMNQLDEIEQLDLVYGEFVNNMRQLARQFQFGTMKTILQNGIYEAEHA